MKPRLPGAAHGALLASLLLVLYLGASFGLSGRADVRRYSSGILDMDVARVVADATGPRAAWRPSVHPLQKLLVAPFGALVERALFAGRDPLGAARVLIALFTAANALAAAALARRLAGGARAPALAAGLLCGVSFSSILAGAIPESAAFAALAGTLPLVWLASHWERPFGRGEIWVWAGLAVLGLGLTVTQVAAVAIALGVRLGVSPGGRSGRARALWVPLVAALALAAAGLLQSRLYPGTPEPWRTSPLAGEAPYLRWDALRREPLGHVARLAGHFLVVDFAAPFPGYSDFLLRGGFDYWSLTLEGAHRASGPAGRALAGLVALAVLAALWRSPRRDPRFLAPALVLGWHLGLHALYGREYVIYSPHWHGVLVALLVAGAWHGLGRRRAWLAPAAAVLAALLLVNNLAVMRAIYREVAFGLEASRRDAEGGLRIRPPDAEGRLRVRPAGPAAPGPASPRTPLLPAAGAGRP